MIEVMLNNEVGFNAPEKTIVETVRCVLLDHMVRRGEVSLAVIDDATMQRLNRTHLQHDYPTDVLSFLLHRDQDMLEGEVIVIRAPIRPWESLHRCVPAACSCRDGRRNPTADCRTAS